MLGNYTSMRTGEYVGQVTGQERAHREWERGDGGRVAARNENRADAMNNVPMTLTSWSSGLLSSAIMVTCGSAVSIGSSSEGMGGGTLKKRVTVFFYKVASPA
eukprot:TRINITY_DN4851_c0_g2_i1.p1 TRINITY_DN4851_c0_g2~~TRINITY_DN4851_c0_g2_i1.p1  ORF type:complete len:103 (-),score=2.80 TRINITY_DN4851_c0_g2_i1:139-447(-)